MESRAPSSWRDLGDAVRVLAPRGGAPLPRFLETSLSAVREPFAEKSVAALGALSAGFLRDPALREDPASVAVAYWMRPAALARLRARFDRETAGDAGVVRVPVGRVFHVAPANVDTLFLYSWALSYLCGNANVVRITQDRTPAVEALLDVIATAAEAEPDLAERNRFVTYEHDAGITAALSGWCSHRILWGGDETIAALRPLALNPHASERTFGSKFSYAVVAARAFLDTGETERTKLVGAFYNDLFWFDQMACSSPHIVFWVGDEKLCESAVTEFERALQAEVDRRGHATVPADAVRRLNYAFGLAADADVRVHLQHPGFVGIEVREVRGLGKQTCGGGLIRHARLDRLEELEAFATEADQTVTHFGFGRDALTALAARVGARGVDRIVPIGEALAFDSIWDGFDLFDDLVRKVTVRVS